jgi:hypothetical protein
MAAHAAVRYAGPEMCMARFTARDAVVEGSVLYVCHVVYHANNLREHGQGTDDDRSLAPQVCDAQSPPPPAILFETPAPPLEVHTRYLHS